MAAITEVEVRARLRITVGCMKFNTRSVVEHERFTRQHGPHHVVQRVAAWVIDA